MGFFDFFKHKKEEDVFDSSFTEQQSLPQHQESDPFSDASSFNEQPNDQFRPAFPDTPSFLENSTFSNKPSFQPNLQPQFFQQPLEQNKDLMLTKLELINQRLEVIDRRLQLIEKIAKESQ